MRFEIAIGTLAAVALTMTAGAALAQERGGHRRDTGSMARQLSISAERVNATAQRKQGWMRGSERRMLTALERFAGSSRRFSDTVAAQSSRSNDARQTLALLNEDSAIVEQSIRHARPMASVLDDWDTCTRLLERINGRFNGGFDGRETARGDQGNRFYEIGGRRYPRNGDLYYRDGQWYRIVASPAVASETTRWYESNGQRYPRNGDLYYRDGQWYRIVASPAAASDTTRWYESNGQRYPRNGDLYNRDGQWYRIVASPGAEVDTTRWYESNGTRYHRSGDRYYRDGRWVPISEQRPTVANVIGNLLLNR